MLRMRIALHAGQSDLPAPLPESTGESIRLAGAAEPDWEEKPSRRSILKISGRKRMLVQLRRIQVVVNAHGKAFKISPITASRTFACTSPEFCSRVTRISACRWVSVFWNRFAISVLCSSQVSYSLGNRVLRPIRIKVFRALSSRASERHNTTSSSLEYRSLKAKLINNNWKTLTKGDESGKRSDGREKTARLSPSPAGS